MALTNRSARDEVVSFAEAVSQSAHGNYPSAIRGVALDSVELPADAWSVKDGVLLVPSVPVQAGAEAKLTYVLATTVYAN